MARSKISPNVALATVGSDTSAFLWWDGPVCYPSQKRCKCKLHLQLTPTTQTGRNQPLVGLLLTSGG